GLPSPATRSSTRTMSRRYAARVCAEARRTALSSWRKASSASRTGRLDRDLGPALRADQRCARLVRLLDHERRIAVRAREHDRLVPQRVVAGRVARARVEQL